METQPRHRLENPIALWKRRPIITTILVAIIVFTFGSMFFGGSAKESEPRANYSINAESLRLIEEPSPAASEQVGTEEGSQEMIQVEYTVVHSKQNYRSDGATGYWILIDQIDVNNDAFKEIVEATVRHIVSERGWKASAAIFDQRGTLELHYKQYGDLSLSRVRTSEESAQAARHTIAIFDGAFSGNLRYRNELSYFPAAFNDTPQVGKYIDTIELRP